MSILRELRKKAGMTQAELASKLSVHQTLISQIERGAVVPSGATLVDLAEFFGVSTDYLLGLDTKSKPRNIAVRIPVSDVFRPVSHLRRLRRLSIMKRSPQTWSTGIMSISVLLFTVTACTRNILTAILLLFSFALFRRRGATLRQFQFGQTRNARQEREYARKGGG